MQRIPWRAVRDWFPLVLLTLGNYGAGVALLLDRFTNVSLPRDAHALALALFVISLIHASGTTLYVIVLVSDFVSHRLRERRERKEMIP